MGNGHPLSSVLATDTHRRILKRALTRNSSLLRHGVHNHLSQASGTNYCVPSLLAHVSCLLSIVSTPFIQGFPTLFQTQCMPSHPMLDRPCHSKFVTRLWGWTVTSSIVSTHKKNYEHAYVSNKYIFCQIMHDG